VVGRVRLGSDSVVQVQGCVMAEAGNGSGHTPLTPEWTPAPRASHYPWQGDRPAADPSNMTSGGNNFNGFVENKLTKFRAVFYPPGCFR